MILKIFAALLVISLVSVGANFDNDEPPPEEPCRHVVVRVVKRQLAELSTCINTMEFKNMKERAKKLACIVKCVATREKILDPDGNLDQAHADAYMKRNIPPSLLAHAKPVLQKCFDMGLELVDPTEEYCHSYKPAIKCVLNEVTKLCDEHDPITGV